MSMPSLLPLQCFKCQSPIAAQIDEVAWVCATCGQAILLDERMPNIVVPLELHYHAQIASGQAGRPFWVVQGTVSVQRTMYRGNETRQAQEFWSQPHTFFVPAFTCSLDELVSLGMKLLRQPVPLTEGKPTPLRPVTLSRVDVHPMMEFIVMGIEAERKDMIKSVQIQLSHSQPVLWVLP